MTNAGEHISRNVMTTAKSPACIAKYSMDVKEHRKRMLETDIDKSNEAYRSWESGDHLNSEMNMK